MGVGGGGGGGSNSRGNYVLPLLNSAESNENIRSNYSKGNPNLIIDISAPHFKVFNMMSNYFLLNSPVWTEYKLTKVMSIQVFQF